MKINYYIIGIFNPIISQEIKYRTLKEAKRALIHFVKKGVRLSSHFIYAKSYKDEYVPLTYTPYYSDTQSFGRTQITTFGKAIKQGRYKI